MKINVKDYRAAEDKEKYIRDKISERPGFWNDLPKMRIIPNHIKKGEFVFEVLEIHDGRKCWQALNFDTYDNCLKHKVEFIEKWKNWQIEECLNGRR